MREHIIRKKRDQRMVERVSKIILLFILTLLMIVYLYSADIYGPVYGIFTVFLFIIWVVIGHERSDELTEIIKEKIPGVKIFLLFIIVLFLLYLCYDLGPLILLAKARDIYMFLISLPKEVVLFIISSWILISFFIFYFYQKDLH